MNKYLQEILESSYINDDEYTLLSTDKIYTEDVEEISMNITPKSARIIQTSQNEYAIELEEVMKVTKYLSESNSSCTEVSALKTICQENDIQLEQISVVIPNRDDFEAFIEACTKEAKGCETEAGKCKAKKKISSVKEKISDMKDKGIKIKKSK